MKYDFFWGVKPEGLTPINDCRGLQSAKYSVRIEFWYRLEIGKPLQKLTQESGWFL
ncbi:hypothetical protein N9414_18333 [Nodularia spumigena CCY9414]|nr:hypothetical protein N9414_18333 [Nodularia spumigena CCY9414]